MNFTIRRDELFRPLQMVANVVERRQTLPILSNILLHLENNRLTLTGTDLEVQMIASVQVEDGVDGSVTVSARKFMDICRALPDESTVSVQLTDDRFLVRSGSSRYTLATLPSSEFPSLDELTEPYELTVPGSALRSLIQRTSFSMAQQDVRYYLNGLLVELDNRNLRAVATDGHRLAYSEAVLEHDTAEHRQVIVPRKGVIELQRLLDDSQEPVTLQIGNSHLRASFGSLVFTTKLVDGRFPDYRRVIPTGGDKVLALDRDSVRQAFLRASVLSNEKFRGVRIDLSDQGMRISMHNPEHEEAEERVSCAYTAEPFHIGFNVQYILDALGVIESPEVHMIFSDPNSSCLIEPAGDVHSRYVVMPMRL